MNKYLYVVIVLIVGVGLDLGTKTLAENRLASRTRDYEHYLELQVPEEAGPTTLEAFLTDQLTWNSEAEIDEIIQGSTFVVDDEGHILRPGSRGLELEPGDHVEVQNRTVTVIGGFLTFRYVENRGAAWGFLSNSESPWRGPFFIGVGVIALGVIFLLVRSAPTERRFLITALALIAGGAVGNIVDRIRYGYVVDFIVWYPGFEWPTFNIADALIVVGVAMMVIEVIRDSLRQRRAPAETAANRD